MRSDSDSKNYYQLLNVERTASKEEIKAAYKSIALVYHPDSNFFSEILGNSSVQAEKDQNEEFFKLLTAAYHTLVNQASRQQYDQSLVPELPGWQDEVSNNTSAVQAGSRATSSNRNASSAAFGVFGSNIYQAEEELHEHNYPKSREAPLIYRLFGLFRR